MSDATHERIVGHTPGGLDTDPAVTPWTAPSLETVEAWSPLPLPPQRPARIEPRRRGLGGGSSQSEPALPAPMPAHIRPDSLAGRVWEQIEDTARIVQDMVFAEREGDDAKRDAAVLMVSLGDHVGGEVIKSLNYWATVELTRTIAGLGEITPEEEQRVQAAFAEHLNARQWVRQGGTAYARHLLERAMGRIQASTILESVNQVAAPRFALLRKLPAHDVAPFIAHEHPQTIALVLSQLEPEQAAYTIEHLPEPLQADVARRIATLTQVTPAVLKAVEESIEDSLRALFAGDQDVGGPKVLAQILNVAGSSTEKTILEQLEGEEPELAGTVRDVMFTFADIGHHVLDKDLAVIVEAFPLETWAMALKAGSDRLKQRVARLLGDERWQQLGQHMEQLGPVRLSDVEALQRQMVHRIRELEADGQLTIVRGVTDEAFV